MKNLIFLIPLLTGQILLAEKNEHSDVEFYSQNLNYNKALNNYSFQSQNWIDSGFFAAAVAASAPSFAATSFAATGSAFDTKKDLQTNIESLDR